MHVVVESYGAYEAARRVYGDGLWNTTSPYVYDRLQAEGVPVRHLESSSSGEDSHDWAKACYDAMDALGPYLNELCPWRGDVDLGLVFSSGLFLALFTALHKGRLLGQAAEHAGGQENVVCVGESGLQPSGISPLYGRFDTVYAQLARKAGWAVMEYRVSREEAEARDRHVRHKRMGKLEKCLSLMTNTPGSFCYKMWRAFKSKRLYPSNHITLNPFARKNFYIYRDCENIEESFLGILFRGGRIGHLPRLPLVESRAVDAESLAWAEDMHVRVLEFLDAALAERGLERGPLAEICVREVVGRLAVCLERLRLALPELTTRFEQMLAGCRENPVVLTNFLSTPEERILNCHLKSKGIKICAFEHGVTLGLSEWSRWGVRHWGTLAADIGCYYTHESVAEVGDHAPAQRKIVIGSPGVERKILFPRLQRFLVRKWLGIAAGEKVVMYLAGTDRNNLIYGPYSENDIQYYEKTKSIIDMVCRDFPDCTFLFKHYPSQRHFEWCDFARHIQKHPKSRILKDMDFRFLRTVPDVLLVAYSQSTLGWVVGSSAVTLYLEFEWSPVRFRGMDMEKKDVPGLRRVIPLAGNRIMSNTMDKAELYKTLFAKEASHGQHA